MPAEQLWLDVDAPPQAAPKRERASGRMADDAVGPDRQSELILAAPEPVVASLVAEIIPGSLSELAKAAKLDRLFPRSGSADDVRARFSLAGADGDAFEALADADRQYERCCRVLQECSR